MMHYYYGGLYPSHMWGFGSIFMIFFWIFIVYLFISLLRGNWGHENRHNHKEDPMEIIKIRFAKGEITKEQFESMKKELS